MKYIASVSWGKDSLAMLLKLIENDAPLDEVVFYDTGMEFKAIYDTRDSMRPVLERHGIKYTELHPSYDFCWQMFERPVNVGKPNEHKGYSWCGGTCRWGTTDKLKALDKYAEKQGAQVYIGIAADETKRIEKERKPYKLFPLVDWGMVESKCLTYCYDHGYHWIEDAGAGEISLYYVLDRVSCWCCTNKNLKELRNVYHYLPQYWERLKDLQSRTCRPMKGDGKSVLDLEQRFILEDEREAAGFGITDRDFFSALKVRLEVHHG